MYPRESYLVPIVTYEPEGLTAEKLQETTVEMGRLLWEHRWRKINQEPVAIDWPIEKGLRRHIYSYSLAPKNDRLPFWLCGDSGPSYEESFKERNLRRAAKNFDLFCDPKVIHSITIDGRAVRIERATHQQKVQAWRHHRKAYGLE